MERSPQSNIVPPILPEFGNELSLGGSSSVLSDSGNNATNQGSIFGN